MNEQQYISLCEACDSFLMGEDSTSARVAISCLHVVREHPVFLSRYAEIFNPGSSWKILKDRIRRKARNMAAWGRQVYRALYSDKHPCYISHDLPDGADVLFVSHFVNQAQAGSERDFYYGDVPNALAGQGFRVAIILINHTDIHSSSAAEKYHGCFVPRIMLSRSLSLRDEFAHRRSLNKESRKLSAMSGADTSLLERRLLIKASDEALSNDSMLNMRIGSQIGLLARRFNPKLLVTTHEGHAWERLSYACARQALPGIECVGYQHAALFRMQHAIRRPLAREYNPDAIVTAGAVGASQLQAVPALKGVPITVLGSDRTFQIDSSDDILKNKLLHGCVCLVLPEGIPNECHLLLGFSLACAKAWPEISFIWRLHPIIQFASLMAENPDFVNLPANIRLSSGSLDDDLRSSRWVLYRGTTAVVQAVMAGLRPMYLNRADEMSVDPLYELESWRVNIMTEADLAGTVSADMKSQLATLKSEARVAIAYCKDFFVPFNPKVLAEIIAAKKTVTG